MRESSTYQAILNEGRVETSRHLLFALGEKRFGKPSATMQRVIEAISDAQRLEQLTTRTLDVNSWDELLAS